MNKIKYIIAPFIALSFLSGCAGRGVTYTVTFKTNSGADDIVKTVRQGYRVNKPDDPVKAGYEFAGWYYDNKTFQYQYNFSTKVCQDFKLYARWASEPIVEFHSDKLTFASAPSTDEYYCGIISLKDQYADDYDVPSIDAFYDVTIGGKEFENFKIENIYSTSHQIKIMIPKSSITDVVSISAEAYEKMLTFTAEEATSISYTNPQSVDVSGMYYQKANDTGWGDSIPWDGTAVSLVEGQKIRLYNTKNTLNSSSKCITFSSTDKIAASGNIMSLVNHNQLGDHAFYNLFKDMTTLTKAPLLITTKLNTYCYENMFEGCTGLKNGLYVYLPAVEFATGCYKGMFKNSGIEKIWINGKNLANNAFEEMFKGCKDIKELQVCFGEGTYWPGEEKCTENWLKDASTTGTFYWNGIINKTELRTKGIYGNDSRIREGWNVANPF